MGGESTPRPHVDSPENRGRESPSVSIIEQPPPSPILVSDETLEVPDSLPQHTSVFTEEGRSVRLLASDEVDQGQTRTGTSSNTSGLGKSGTTDACEEFVRLVKTCSCANLRDTKKNVKGLPLCQVIQESGASEVQDADSGGGSCAWDDTARLTYHKLMHTLQVLANKEETVRVQGESLRVAKARIASLTASAARLRAELDEKAQELRTLRRAMDNSRAEKCDVSVTANEQDVEHQKKIVSTLQTSLSVIEDLYRECFYETAKQEELIELLRKSYLDVRLMDKEKCDQIGRLQNVINTQRWSLDRCQDIAMEVEGLKMEISNFLSSSSNDSGMWERSESSRVEDEVAEDLQHITQQLLQLRDMLTGDCTCGLEQENMRLKDLNETLQIQVGSLRQRVSELETALADKEKDQTFKDEVAKKEQELNSVRRRLAELETSVGDRTSVCDVLSTQLRQAQVSIEDQTRELVEARRRCQGHEDTINQLNEELEKANRIITEGRALREEVSSMRSAVRASSEHTRALAAELQRAHEHCRALDACYREKAGCAGMLQSQLEAAHARGAQLCAEVRRVVCAAQRALRRMRNRQREQENRIKELEILNKALQQRNETGVFDVSADPCCSTCLSLHSKRACSRATETTNSGTCSKCPEVARRDTLKHNGSNCEFASSGRKRRQERVISSGSKTVVVKRSSHSLLKETSRDSQTKIREKPLRLKISGSNTAIGHSSSNIKHEIHAMDDREYSAQDAERLVYPKRCGSDEEICECSRAVRLRDELSRTSGSEMASCSSAPTPPRSLLKKKFSPTEEKVSSWWCGARRRVSAGTQQPARRDSPCACRSHHLAHLRLDRLPREASPSAELEQRVSALQEALERSQARWTHARSTS